MSKIKNDYTLETLLDLHGYIAEIGAGFWVKIEARKVPENPNKPFGIKYSLTLHTPKGDRILGYDNAHGLAGEDHRQPHDHKHRGATVKKYSYENAENLLSDFWNDVDKILKNNVYE
ncbi:MAG: DUF6516 family protein [Gammaproteobacteria bacterium]